MTRPQRGLVLLVAVLIGTVVASVVAAFVVADGDGGSIVFVVVGGIATAAVYSWFSLWLDADGSGSTRRPGGVLRRVGAVGRWIVAIVLGYASLFGAFTVLEDVTDQIWVTAVVGLGTGGVTFALVLAGLDAMRARQ